MLPSTLKNITDNYSDTTAGKFVEDLVLAGIKLERININSWEDSPKKRVYVDDLEYTRFGRSTFATALYSARIYEKNMLK
jgi:hypothetical protein